MGKLNVAKMANFMEVDVYVLVACPESSLMDSQVLPIIINYYSFYQFIPCPYIEIHYFLLLHISAVSASDLITLQDFYKPVVTPFEMELACTR